MAAMNDILQALPMDGLAQQIGADREQTARAVEAALPALLGGLQANASDPAGAASLRQALGDHDPALVDGGVDLSHVDTGDGEKITAHIFGGKTDQVTHALGASPATGSVTSALVKKLLPILAPIVLSYLAKQMSGGGSSGGVRPSQGTSGGPGSLQDMLGQVLGGAATGSGQAAPRGGAGGIDAGSIITDVLGGLLGGGRR